jgi:hypothetical protein
VALCRLFQLIVLLCRSERSKELEILVLRHELAILRRHSRRAPFRRADRAMLAALARVLPRSALGNLPVRPATLLRWPGSWSGDAGRIRTDLRDVHRSTDGWRRSLFGSLARTRVGATGGSSASCEALASPFGDLGTDDPHPSRAAASTAEGRAYVASLSAPARCDDARV